MKKKKLNQDFIILCFVICFFANTRWIDIIDDKYDVSIKVVLFVYHYSQCWW